MKQAFPRRIFLAATGAAMTAPAGVAVAAQAGETIPLPSGKVRMVLDTDTYNEIDDQFAVASAMLAPNAMTVEALYAAPFLNNRSTSAGDGMEKSYEEILRVLERIGKTGAVEVFKGSGKFMKDAGRPVDSPAARDLIKKAMAAREMLYVATIGAPTNVASALRMEPKIKDKITVVWLGGRPLEFPTAHEFNLRQDPPSSQVLFDCGAPLVMIPTTNVSEQLRTTVAEMGRYLKGKSKIGDYLYGIFLDYEKAHKGDGRRAYSKVIWDISAVAWLINPEWVQTKLVSSPILADDLRWGLTQGRHQIRVATHVDRDAIFGDLFARLAKA